MTNVTMTSDEKLSNITWGFNSCQGESEVERVIDASVLTVTAVIGTLGNLLVILTRLHGRRLFKHGNIFILNLALADYIVTGIFVPITIANVITKTNVLSDVMCHVMAYFLCISCACSASNMTSVAINRYWYIVRRQTYASVFNRRTLSIAVVLNWIWACLLFLPPILGWGEMWFDKDLQFCGFNYEKSTSYNIAVLVPSSALPIGTIIICYWKIFAKVSEGQKKLRSITSPSGGDQRHEKRKQLKKEYILAKTFSITVIVYILCWTPIGFTVLINESTSLFGKISSRLLLANSMMNFIIYGIMNPKYRQEYATLLRSLLCCKQLREKKSYNRRNDKHTTQHLV